MLRFYLIFSSVYAFGAVPAFRCTSGNQQIGVYLEKKLGKPANRLEVTEGGKTRTIALSTPGAAFSEGVFGDWILYHGTKANGFDFGQELRIRYSTDTRGSDAQLFLVLDHRAAQPLVCETTKNFVTVKTSFDAETQRRFLSEAFGSLASLRKKTGFLQNSAQTMLVELVQRFALLSPTSLTSVRNEILKIHKSSVASITEQLSGDSKKLWVKTLAEIRYDYFPESDRFLIWIKEGTRPKPLRNLESVTAALNGFVRLPAYRSDDLKKHFVAESKTAIKEIQEEELPLLRPDLTESGKKLFDEIWISATGKKTLANYPILEEILMQLTKAIKKTGNDFDAQTVEKRAMAFYKSTLAQDPEAKKLFLENARPLFKGLSARQLEDLMSWVEEEEKPLFEQLVN